MRTEPVPTKASPAARGVRLLDRIRELALSPAEQRYLIAWLAERAPDALAAGLDLIVSERPPAALDLPEHDALLAQLTDHTSGDVA